MNKSPNRASCSDPDLGANARINAFIAWRVFQTAMSRLRLHATSTAKSISGAMNTPQFHLLLLPPVQTGEVFQHCPRDLYIPYFRSRGG